MRPIEFFKNIIRANSGYSSKRLCALILLGSGITIPTICLFMKPLGVIDDSVLMLSLQLLASGCGLLGFTLGEKYMSPITKTISKLEPFTKVAEEDKKPKSTKIVYGVKCDNEEAEG